MNKKLRKAEKAYKNIDFINSGDARVIRILAELLEPMQRFRKYKINDTIVFFGSARTKPPIVAIRHLKEIGEKINAIGRQNKKHLLEKLENAKNQVFIARYYQDAVELAKRLTAWSKSLNSNSRFVVCSGGGLGMMEAANKGAKEAGGKSIGLNISIPMEQVPNQYITPELNFEFHYFFMRKFWFVYLAKGLVIFPGGFGTMDELFEVLTLLQTKKLEKQLPIVIYGSEYWKQVINFDAMIKYGTISKSDLKLFQLCDTVDEAFSYLTTELTRLYL
ncbi:MAG: LOG family protein [Atribacterota bacterium]|nr:LOG family protein [Atribacterota bacterium]MDD4896243.1 LOG family protein [Atribacterota bacterium]MDD5637077.1 LOG family protein [Atribacterota bacterium]